MAPSAAPSLEFVADPDQVASLTSPRPVGHGPVRAYDWIAHHTRQRPDKEAVRDLGSGRSFTYAELDRRIDAMAAYLASIGVGAVTALACWRTTGSNTSTSSSRALDAGRSVCC